MTVSLLIKDLTAHLFTGGDEASSVPLPGDSILHQRADGVQVPRHTRAARARAPRLRAPPAPPARPPRYVICEGIPP